MPDDGLLCAETTDAVLNAFYKVYNTLGFGFLEKVYENALRVSLEKKEIVVLQQEPVDVFFEGVQVGLYFADLIVSHKVIVEVKSASALAPEHEAQLLN